MAKREVPIGEGPSRAEGGRRLGGESGVFLPSLFLEKSVVGQRFHDHVQAVEFARQECNKRRNCMYHAGSMGGFYMFTNYTNLNTNITRAIRNHLMDVDALPPTMALAELASEITDVVFAEMNKAGLTKETIDRVENVRSVGARVVRSAA